MAKCFFAKLILFCIQSNINNPVKAGEGLDLGGCGFELAEALFQGVFDRVHVLEIVVAKGLSAHFAPDQFLGVASGTLSRQPGQRQIVRDDRRLD